MRRAPGEGESGARVLIVVSYDISDNRRRNRVAKLLEGYGARQLESLFECDLSAPQWGKLRGKMLKLLCPKEDRARAYFLCETCAAKTEIVGGGEIERSPSTYIV